MEEPKPKPKMKPGRDPLAGIGDKRTHKKTFLLRPVPRRRKLSSGSRGTAHKKDGEAKKATKIICDRIKIYIIHKPALGVVLTSWSFSKEAKLHSAKKYTLFKSLWQSFFL